MYLVNENTLFLMYDGINTIVKEQEEEYRYPGDVLKQILDNSCTINGSSLKGRIKGSKVLLEGKYLLPIIVSERKEIILFPIKDKDGLVWINFKNYCSYKHVNNMGEITFKNGYKRLFNVSSKVINNQLMKCSRIWLLIMA